MADTRNLNEKTLKTRMEREIMNQVTLPNGKLDVEKAKLVLEELQMRLKVLNSKGGIEYVKQNIANTGGSVHSTIHTTTNVISDIRDRLSELVKESGIGNKIYNPRLEINGRLIERPSGGK